MKTDYEYLGEAIEKFLKSRDLELSTDPMEQVNIPISGGQTLVIPVAFLATQGKAA